MNANTMTYNKDKFSKKDFPNKQRVWEQTDALYNLITLPWSKWFWGCFCRPG